MSLKKIIEELKLIDSEREYWESEARTAYDVIKQLTEGPREIILVHPYDVAGMLQELGDLEKIVDVKEAGTVSDRDVLTIKDKKYRMTTIIPPSKKYPVLA